MFQWSIPLVIACVVLSACHETTAPNQPAERIQLVAVNDAGLSLGPNDSIGLVPYSIHGKPFTIAITGYVGDTSHIHFSFVEPPDSALPTHTVRVFAPEWKTSSKYDSASIGLIAFANNMSSNDSCWASKYHNN